MVIGTETGIGKPNSFSSSDYLHSLNILSLEKAWINPFSFQYGLFSLDGVTRLGEEYWYILTPIYLSIYLCLFFTKVKYFLEVILIFNNCTHIHSHTHTYTYTHTHTHTGKLYIYVKYIIETNNQLKKYHLHAYIYIYIYKCIHIWFTHSTHPYKHKSGKYHAYHVYIPCIHTCTRSWCFT